MSSSRSFSSAYIEARSWGGLWGTSATANPIGQYTTRFFTVPRSSRRQSLYLKYVDPSGKVSRYPTLIQINYPLVPSLPSAVLDSSDRLFPEVSLFLPADSTDVFGVEIRDSDNTTVLYQYGDLALAISPDDPALIWVWDNSASKLRTKTLYAYCWNTLGEYSSAHQIDISMPAPGVPISLDSSASVQGQFQFVWGTPSGWTDTTNLFYELQIASDAAFTTDLETFGDLRGTHLELYRPNTSRYWRVRASDTIGFGDYGTYGSPTAVLSGQPSIINNHAISETRAGWDAGGVLTDVTKDGVTVKADRIVTTGAVEVASDYAIIDPTQIYRITLSINDNTAPSGIRGFGLYAFNAAKSLLTVTPFVVATRSWGTPTNAPHFWYGVATSGWRDMATFILPSTAMISDVPVGLNVTNHFKMPANVKYIKVRYYNSNNVGNQATADFFSPSVVPVHTVGDLDGIADTSGFARTTPTQRDGGGYGYLGLGSGGNVKPGKFVDSNPGVVTGQAQIADGTTDDETGYWVSVATVDFQVPANCASMQFTLTPSLGGGTSGPVVLYTSGDNIGIAIYTGTIPNDPTVSRYGTGAVTYPTPSGTKLSVYMKGKPGTREYIEGKCSQDLVTPLRSGMVT